MAPLLLLLGAGSDGKTAFCQRYTGQRLSEQESSCSFRGQAFSVLEMNEVSTLHGRDVVNVVALFGGYNVDSVKKVFPNATVFQVKSKCDLLPGARDPTYHYISSRTGEGCDFLLEHMLATAST